ncbi:MAG: hypothetical protein JWM69_744 [Candidatus Binatus sp.]|nr:hypothetical protein [Candidatus Binatus sp.]
MAEEEEKERGFKVQDRRRFSAEGETKPETEDTKAKSETEATGFSGGENAFTIGKQPQDAQNAGGDVGPEINFATFLVGLSGEALAALGEMPSPVSGEKRRDLIAAQQLIDIIAVLQEKTRGNLDQYEQNLIEAILFDLRMKYVEVARQQAR